MLGHDRFNEQPLLMHVCIAIEGTSFVVLFMVPFRNFCDNCIKKFDADCL